MKRIQYKRKIDNVEESITIEESTDATNRLDAITGNQLNIINSAMKFRTILFILFIVMLPLSGWYLKNGGLFNWMKVYSATAFAPVQLTELVKNDNDNIIGACIDAYSKYENDDPLLKFSKFEDEGNSDDGQYGIHSYCLNKLDYGGGAKYIEGIKILSIEPSTLYYCISDKEDYEEFFIELNNLKAILVPETQRDSLHPNDSTFLLNDCLFIKLDYKDALKANCIAIKFTLGNNNLY